MEKPLTQVPVVAGGPLAEAIAAQQPTDTYVPIDEAFLRRLIANCEGTTDTQPEPKPSDDAEVPDNIDLGYN